MEPITPEKKQPIMKTLAVAGLLGIIVFVAWLAVQIVQVFPNAMTSLASLANSVYNYNPNITRDLELSGTSTMVNHNDTAEIKWENLNLPGTYTFLYECNPGLALNLSTSEKEYAELTCDKSYELGNVDGATLTIYSNNERFTDLKYTISFYRTNSTNAVASNSGSLTIVNETIKLAAELPATETPIVETATTTPEVKPEPEPVKPVATSTPTVKPTPVATTTPTKPVATKPKPTTPTYIYEIPVSNPNGTTDLVVSYLGTGQLYTNGMFNNTGVINYNQPGGVQFAVHNVGSKTSDTWTFEAKLPGNITYTSDKQTPLKPNERAVLTVSFGPTKETSTQNIIIKIDTKSDTNFATNYLNQPVLVLR